MNTQTRRQEYLRILSLAPAETLERFLSGLDLPSWTLLRGPESGLVMVRGRIGGEGPLFNVGEALVTRCVVELPGNICGCGYVLGEAPRHAELAALCDALWQQEAYASAFDGTLKPELENLLQQREDAAATEVSPTKVDFFTLVRGEDK